MLDAMWYTVLSEFGNLDLRILQSAEVFTVKKSRGLSTDRT
jgi:hypothetical protein